MAASDHCLLAGNFRDPLVGRDLLVGTLLRAIHALNHKAVEWTGNWVGVRPHLDVFLDVLHVPGGTARWLFMMIHGAVFPALAICFLMFLFRLVLRREWLAVTTIVLLMMTAGNLGNGATLLQNLFGLLGVTLADAVAMGCPEH